MIDIPNFVLVVCDERSRTMSFVIFVVNEIKVIVAGYPHRSLKTPFFKNQPD